MKDQTQFKIIADISSPRFTEKKDLTYLFLVEALCKAYDINLFEEHSGEYIDWDIPETQFTPYQHHFKLTSTGTLPKIMMKISAIHIFTDLHQFEGGPEIYTQHP
jgi:hypothetical protein